MLPVTIRDAKANDGAVIAQAQQDIALTPGILVARPSELHTTRIVDQIFQLTASSRAKYIVAESGGKVIGHAWLEPVQFESLNHIVRLTLVTHKGWERQGVGQQMLSALLDWAKAGTTVHRIEALTRATNAAAITLWKKNGFVEEGRLRERIRLPQGGWIDDVILSLLIPRN
jgi:RimJ/RimL family protein N-acetyltransferase